MIRGAAPIAKRLKPSRQGDPKMLVKVHVIFYSMYGHVFKMAEAVATGARTVPGVEVQLF
jgi:hypothetical protein